MLNFVGKERNSEENERRLRADKRAFARLKTFCRHLCPYEITNVTHARTTPAVLFLFPSILYIPPILSRDRSVSFCFTVKHTCHYSLVQNRATFSCIQKKVVNISVLFKKLLLHYFFLSTFKNY